MSKVIAFSPLCANAILSKENAFMQTFLQPTASVLRFTTALSARRRTPFAAFNAPNGVKSPHSGGEIRFAGEIRAERE